MTLIESRTEDRTLVESASAGTSASHVVQRPVVVQPKRRLRPPSIGRRNESCAGRHRRNGRVDAVSGEYVQGGTDGRRRQIDPDTGEVTGSCRRCWSRADALEEIPDIGLLLDHNKGFRWRYELVLRYLRHTKAISPGAADLAGELIKMYSDATGKDAFPAQVTLSAAVGCNEETLRKRLRELYDAKVLVWYQHRWRKGPVTKYGQNIYIFYATIELTKHARAMADDDAPPPKPAFKNPAHQQRVEEQALNEVARGWAAQAYGVADGDVEIARNWLADEYGNDERFARAMTALAALYFRTESLERARRRAAEALADHLTYGAGRQALKALYGRSDRAELKEALRVHTELWAQERADGQRAGP